MIVYADTSVVLKLLIDEPGSDRAERIWDAAADLVSVSLITVEGRAALAAARRGGRLDAASHRRAVTVFGELVDQLALVAVTDEVIAEAAPLAEAHALRCYDAVHLAAARLSGAQVMASADTALCDAADQLGLHIANPLVV